MAPFMAAYDQQTYALLRIVSGFLFLWHGLQKLSGFPAAASEEMPAFIGFVAGPIELGGDCSSWWVSTLAGRHSSAAD